MEKLSKLNNETINSYYQELFDRDLDGVHLHATYYDNITFYQTTYNRIVNICVNRELKAQYNLTAYSEVEYCITNDDNKLNIDFLDWLFLLGISLLIMVTFSASIYDWHLQRKLEKKPAEHYTVLPDTILKRLMVSFSIVRNWYKFIGPSNDHSLKTINTMRFAFMLLVVAVHTMFFHNSLPVLNPDFMEQRYHQLSSMFLINGTILMQSFFCVSGFLLGYFFFKYVDGEKFRWSYFWIGLIYRYLRYVKNSILFNKFH